jgi:hypothetical protein
MKSGKRTRKPLWKRDPHIVMHALLVVVLVAGLVVAVAYGSIIGAFEAFIAIIVGVALLAAVTIALLSRSSIEKVASPERVLVGGIFASTVYFAVIIVSGAILPRSGLFNSATGSFVLLIMIAALGLVFHLLTLRLLGLVSIKR